MKAWIAANTGAVFAATATLGALLHWAKKAYRGETSWNPLDYWLADHPGNSAGAIGALVVAVWGVIFSDSLTGMQLHMVVAGGFTLGWMLDSGINKASAAPAQAAPARQAGFARVQLLAVLAALSAVFALGGCGVMQELTQPLHGDTALTAESPQMRAARIAVDEANASLTALNIVIGDNADTGVWTKSQAQGYLDDSKKYGEKVDKARDLMRDGLLSEAKSQAELVKSLILTLHKRAADAARKEK